MIAFIISAIIATALYWVFAKNKKQSDLKQQGKWLLSYVYYRWLSKKPPLFKFDMYSEDLGKLGMVPLPVATLTENPRQLSSQTNAIDAIHFSGYNKNGDVLCMQLSRRHNRVAEVSVYFRLNNGDEYQLPIQPSTTVYNTDGKSFSAAGLTLEVLDPLKRWRVCFNGHLRKVSPKSENDEDVVLVKFNLLWSTLLNYVSYPEDYDPTLLANYVSEKCDLSPFELFDKMSSNEVQQFGQMKGLVKMDNKEEFKITLRGLKRRTHGYENTDKIKHKFSIEGILHNGCGFYVSIENVEDGLQQFLSGYVVPPCDNTVHHLSHCQLKVKNICNDNFKPSSLTFDFTAGKSQYRLCVKVRNYSYLIYEGENHQLSSTTNPCDVTLNNKPGDGILRFSHRHHLINNIDHSLPSNSHSLPLLKQSDLKSTDKLVVSFYEVECQSEHLVGGKGTSLSLMSHIQSHHKFTVPSGLCVTKTAFELHLKENNHLQKAIQKLQQISCTSGSPQQLPAECENLVKLIESTAVSGGLRQQMEMKLKEIFGSNYNQNRYAIRSSAIGEDGEELSAAGQNETYLGVKGLDQICSCIVRCWASQFGFRSVEYQRQNGQLLNKGMAVVVQEMVPAEVAGVLFSRNPVTGSPAELFITSNYGLGETVVSAAVDPDTVILKRSWDDHLSLHQVQIGSKKVQINMSDNGTVEVETTDTSKCSLSEEMALKLGQLALYLEKCYGNSRDIEFAIQQGNLYLLQSRPVTTDNQMSDYEIMHEYDTPLKTDKEGYTTANVAEVLPGASNPLSISILLGSQVAFFNVNAHSETILLSLVEKYMMWKADVYKYEPLPNDQCMAMFYNNFFFDLVLQKSWSLEKKKTETTKAFEVGVFGRVLDDDDVVEIALERFSIQPPFWHKSKLTKIMAVGMIAGNWILKKEEKITQALTIPSKGHDDPLECLNAVTNAALRIHDALYTHFAATVASTMWNLITLNILTKKNQELTTDQYSDFATLVGSAIGAESGNVPASLEELATVIAKVTDAKVFATMETEEALKWLQTNTNEANAKFQEFLDRHGHRGLKEIDYMCITWSMDPKQVVKAVQGILHGGPPKARAKILTSNLIDQIKTPLTPFRKFLLKFVMKGCRMGVCHREKAKSLIIKRNDFVRLGFRELSQLLIKRGYFSDPDLIFFFNAGELYQLIETRSSKLIRRAKHRQRIHKIMDEYRFPEMIRGEPVPIGDTNNIKLVENGVKVTGLPVSQGTIKAQARVITKVKDVHTIQPGEILITHATDIGWSPYFPLLSGVVTELGGLVSHGAVVARECGLPCLVGIENATNLFQTGDTVYLNATDGYIVKIENE